MKCIRPECEKEARKKYCSRGCQRLVEQQEAKEVAALRTAALPSEDLPAVDFADMHKELRRLQRDLDRANNKKAQIVAAVNEAVLEALGTLRVDPPQAQRIDRKDKAWKMQTEEVAIVHASDWQLGKQTPSYNSDICEQRVQAFARKVIHLSEIQNADHPVRTARLYLTGDLVEGEGIFPTQQHVIDSGIYRQVMVNGPRILGGLVLDLLSYFDQIHVVGVIGNHGEIRLRSGTADPESNADRMLYRGVYNMLMGHEGAPTPLAESGRVTWNIPDGPGERNFYAVDHVSDWGFLLFHGDQIKGGFAGFPWYGAAKKAWGWIDAIPEPWDYGMFGHFHTATRMTLNHRILYCNGSTESSNTFAQEQLAAAGTPTQYLGFVHPKIGITADYWVNLAEEGKTPNRVRGRQW